MSEEILTYMGFTHDRPFGDYLRHLYRFWEGSFYTMYHLVITTRRVILVRMSNPFDSSLFGPLLLDGIFYFPRLRWFKDRVLEGRLDKALETNLKKWVYPIELIAGLDYDKKAFGIRFKDGGKRTFRLRRFAGSPMTSLGGDFAHKASLSAAVAAFNSLAASN